MSKYLLKPSDIPVTPRRKSSNKRISGEWVLTSAEIYSLLKEKEEKKKEAEEKEPKKTEREIKKKLREEAQKKAEEKKKKAEERA